MKCFSSCMVNKLFCRLCGGSIFIFSTDFSQDTQVLNYNLLPFQLLKWQFNWKYMVRGLVLDKRRGNILKVLCFTCEFP